MRHIILLIVGAALLAAGPGSAQNLSGGSLQQCMASCVRPDVPACYSNDPAAESMCEGARASCQSTCNQNSWRWNGSGNRRGGAPAPARRAPRFAAIAVDPRNGHWGYAYDADHNFYAVQRARQECMGAGGRDCSWNEVVADGCIAYVKSAGPRGGMIQGGSFTDRQRNVAEVRRSALANCQRSGGVSCQVVTTICAWGKQ